MNNIRYIIFLSMFLSSCSIEPVGEFKTDIEMIDYLAANLEIFTRYAELGNECNTFDQETRTSSERTGECKSLFDSLGIIGARYYKSKINDASIYDVERVSFAIFSLNRGLFNNYDKGYVHYYNTDTTEFDLWSGNFDTPPAKKNCDNYNRIIQIIDDRISEKWYLTESEGCD